MYDVINKKFNLHSIQGLIIYEMLSGVNPFKLRNKTKY